MKKKIGTEEGAVVNCRHLTELLVLELFTSYTITILCHTTNATKLLRNASYKLLVT